MNPPYKNVISIKAYLRARQIGKIAWFNSNLITDYSVPTAFITRKILCFSGV
ncbi:hypothetical protein L289_0339 [Acinetobacter gerneri DSM 14967 = CIP 107464 = MTCC 9824]|uniref:hypothetical protein n=1 Tax=Acinetobacter gerneri TaxID=202952 RepID=UPI00035A80D3|nr:hypothetical protein [Acinetobacter gerneri]EPR85159.1 hypothetical protein L289_0339 [Acinetobacter gerneri DSM 14967 = CIP 107464 = MTCC 9824]